MATDNNLTLDDVLNFEVSTTPASSVADREAQLKKYEKQFDFDPSVSLASEMELQRQQEINSIREKAQSNPKTQEFLNSSDSNARIAAADVDGLNSVADGLGKINGVGNLSIDSMQSNLVDINANKFGGVFKSIAKDLNQKNALNRAAEKNTAIGKIKTFDPSKPPENKIEPIQKQGNKYWNSVKRGSASIIQLGSLLADGGYEAFERGADLVTGWDVNGHVPYKTNKVFDAMTNLKENQYKQSSQLFNLMAGSDLAGQQAKANGENEFLASMGYLAKNGSFGDTGELLSEFIPSLYIGYGAGGIAEKFVANATGKYVSNVVGRSIATNSIINPVRLAAIDVVAPKAAQGAIMAGTADFTSSLATEVEAQKSRGYEDNEAVGRALDKSLAQAGVSALGGSLLPLRFGGDFTTVVGQSAIQGLFGYGSAAAGAKSIGDDLSSTEGALNVLLGAVAALPEVIAVGGLSINKSEVKTQLDDFIVERAIADVAQKQELQDTRSVYFGSTIRELISRVKDSKTKERSPETLNEFIRTIQDDPEAAKEAYIDAERFNQLAVEHNIDVDAIFNLAPEFARDYQRVNDIDGLIRVPIDELLTAFSSVSNEQYLNAFADSLRHNPEALTAGEARAEFAKTSKDMEADISAIKQEFEQVNARQKELKTVADIIENDLNSLSFGFENSTGYNKLSSSLVSAFYETLADKSGISAMELYKSMPLRVVSNQDQANALGSDVNTFNQQINSTIGDEIASLDKSDFQKHIKDKYSLNLGMIEDKENNSISIEKIIVPSDSRQSGVGTKAMQEIIAYADANNKKLTLTPSSDFGGNKKRLSEFYKRFGFIENKGKDKDFQVSDAMYRNAKSAESFNQKFANEIRGQIQFRTDKKGAVIILGKNADFSTFSHELGHHFLEVSMIFANRADAPEQLKSDMIELMRWSGQGENLDDWSNLSADQRTEIHEKFAETFEQYMFTGKSPSNELRKVFARFRTFMAAVYSNIQKFLGTQTRAELNPEIRDIMDRMLATKEAIEQVQKQRNLEFTIAQDKAMEMGISPKEYLDMVDESNEATEKAINELEQKTLKDLARYRTLRNKHVKVFSEQQKRIRQQVREKIAEEVAAMPVYQVLSFLRQPVDRVEKVKRDSNVIDEKIDTLLEAVAKIGGINAKEIESTWGIDQPESHKVNVGRVKKVARKDGLSIESVAERLADHGYLSVDENGKFDTHEFENLFTDSLSGGKYYSRNADPELFMMGDDYGLAMGYMDEFPDNGKLNIEWLKAKYGEDSEIFKAVGKTGQYGLAMKDGLDPDMVANNFGYESADSMIQDMARAAPPKDIIEERANGLIQAQHADLFDSQSIEMAIDEAVHNDLRAMMLSRELTAITKLQGRQSEFNAVAKSVAQNIIDNSLITEIRPHLFSAAELRQSKAYDKALKSGNTLDAIRAKRQQLINFHAVKQAYEANQFVDKLFDLTKTISGNDAKLAKNRDFNLVTLARFVAATYGLTDQKINVRDQMKSIKEYDPTTFAEMADLIGISDDGSFTPKLEVKNYNEMTLIEFTQLNDMLRQIWHRSKESQKIKVGDARIEFSKVVEDLSTSAFSKPSKARNAPLLGYAPNASGFNPRRSLQTLKRAEQFFTWLDNGKSDGFFHKYVFNPMQDKLADYRIEQRKMMQSVVDIFSEFNVMHGKIDASELGGTRKTFDSKQELLHAILNTGNESNKKRLILGFGWGEKIDKNTVDYSRWDGFMDRMYQDGVITKKDMDAIQKIWDLFDGYKEQAQKVHKNINGLYFKELPKNKIITPFGEYDGGYIPADYNKNADVNAELIGRNSEATTQSQGLHGAGISTGASFTKSRVDNFDGFELILDLTRLPNYLDKELRYIHLEENLKQASKIFRNKDVLNGIESASPFATTEIIQDWLRAVSDQKVNKGSEYSGLDQFVETLKRNSGIVLMAGNIKNAVEAWTSIPQLLTVVPKKEMALASSKYFTDFFSRESMVGNVRAKSKFMDSRLDNVANDMRYQLDNIVTNPSNFKKGTDFLRKNAYFFQQIAQVPLESISWTAAFNDAQTKGMNEADAVNHADGVIRMYLNDMSPDGISKIERSHPLMRAMLMFYGWFNMVHNTWAMRNNLVSENKALSKAQKFGSYAGLYTMFIAMPAMLSKALTLSFNGELFDNEDAEGWADDIVNITIKSQVEMLMGMLPFARDFLNPIYRTSVDATIYSDRYSVSPITSMAENMVKTGKRVVESVADDGEMDSSNLTKGVLQSATFATGVPFTLVQRPATYGADVLIDGDQEPKNIADAVRGSVNGK